VAVTFKIRPNDGLGVRRVRRVKGQTEQIKIDFAPWSDQAGVTLTSMTQEVVSGTATFGTVQQSDNTWIAFVSTPDEGGSLIKVIGTDAGGSYLVPVVLALYARDPSFAAAAGSDYWY